MTTAYYITYTKHTVGGDWYMLMVRDTHFCIACGSDLGKILTSLRRSVKRNKTKARLMRELSGLDCQGKVSPATYSQREEYYRNHGKDYEDLVLSVVQEALREVREEEKTNSPLRKTTSRLKRSRMVSPIKRTTVETIKKDIPPAQDSPKILRKPWVFKHK